MRAPALQPPALLTVPGVCEDYVAQAAKEAKQQRLVYSNAEVGGCFRGRVS